MQLPTIQHPTFNATLPDSKREITYRPFLRGEEKILLMAKESGEHVEMEQATSDIIKRCTNDSIDPKSLSNIDLEYLFLKLRIASKGKTTTIGVKCRHNVTREERTHPIHGVIPAYNGPCDTVNEITINFDNVDVQLPNNDDKIIKITDDIGMEMRYPSSDIIAKHGKIKTESDAMKLVYECIDTVFWGEEMTNVDDLDDKDVELDSFFDQFNDEQLVKVVNFFKTIPCLKMDVEFKCKSCGHVDTVKLRGLSDFF